jgi:hypothetical protein
MNQDRNYMTENSYTNEIKFNLYIFNIYKENLSIVIGEKIKDNVLDKTAYNLWKKLFDNLNKGEDLEIAIDIFVRDYFAYELPVIPVERMMEKYENNSKIFLYHNDVERIRVTYKKALRDSNIDSILEE